MACCECVSSIFNNFRLIRSLDYDIEADKGYLLELGSDSPKAILNKRVSFLYKSTLIL